MISSYTSIAVARIAVPYTGIIVSTREKESVRSAQHSM